MIDSIQKVRPINDGIQRYFLFQNGASDYHNDDSSMALIPTDAKLCL